jgi:hypothetical protein
VEKRPAIEISDIFQQDGVDVSGIGSMAHNLIVIYKKEVSPMVKF